MIFARVTTHHHERRERLQRVGRYRGSLLLRSVNLESKKSLSEKLYITCFSSSLIFREKKFAKMLALDAISIFRFL